MKTSEGTKPEPVEETLFGDTVIPRLDKLADYILERCNKLQDQMNLVHGEAKVREAMNRYTEAAMIYERFKDLFYDRFEQRRLTNYLNRHG